MSIFDTQTKVVFTGSTGNDLTTATSVDLIFTSPRGVQTSVSATIDDAANGLISYEPPVSPAFFDTHGTWRVYAVITYNDGRIQPSEVDTFKVYETGELIR